MKKKIEALSVQNKTNKHSLDEDKSMAKKKGKTAEKKGASPKKSLTLEPLKLFPKLNKPPSPKSKMSEAQKMVGKQIKKVEFGKEEFCKDCHQCEAINIYFTDGTAMTIRIGSNAGNIATKYSQIKPSEIDTDLMLFWAEKLQSNDE